MEKLKVAGGQGRLTSCVDPRQIQRLNQHAETLFGKEHLLEPNFSAPMVFPDKYEDSAKEELLGIEYAYGQSTDFSPNEYYIQKAEEEQSHEGDEIESESEDEGIEDEGEDTDANDRPVDPMDSISAKHAVVTKEEQITEEISPVLEDVLMRPSHLHLPGYEEVESLALLLLQLSDDGA
ncbi:PREDICTED: uncharacterized protein LOC106814728 isoform X2 [Priapulus caudatus]|uniref:Uncharacterized protein LOC106814728 isoform X2 n=1 Tax=Priapulus caudatus TaxID=37621 RepID=A0ABM1EQT9_PRICU|nr:PREDICTED: uncharacterized protein LOC106814728 isoform X2 [Priapulus caudatus]